MLPFICLSPVSFEPNNTSVALFPSSYTPQSTHYNPALFWCVSVGVSTDPTVGLKTSLTSLKKSALFCSTLIFLHHTCLY